MMILKPFKVHSPDGKTFYDLCDLLPADVHWNDPITPNIVRHIRAALSAPADGGAAPLTLTDEQMNDLARKYFGAQQPTATVTLYQCREFARAILARSAQPQGVTDAARDVLAERERQVSKEGWTLEHDDKHSEGLMARAAACYAMAGTKPVSHLVWKWDAMWPWDRSWWKPTTPRRDLVKAAALILAEIERLDRASTKAGE